MKTTNLRLPILTKCNFSPVYGNGYCPPAILRKEININLSGLILPAVLVANVMLVVIAKL